jgi:hypothetical protein
LKKQSQFVPAQMGAKSFVKGAYENKSRRGLRENIANSKPVKPNPANKFDGMSKKPHGTHDSLQQFGYPGDCGRVEPVCVRLDGRFHRKIASRRAKNVSGGDCLIPRDPL